MSTLKKLYSVAAVFAIALLALSCSTFHDEPDKSVWAGGFWAVPWLFAIAAVIFFISAYRSSVSGSVRSEMGRTVPSEGNVKMWRTWQFWAGIIFTAACFGVIAYANSDYWR